MNADPTHCAFVAGREGAVVTLTFNRPMALHAIDVPMAQSFLTTVDIAAEANVPTVLLRGNGKAFMAALFRILLGLRRCGIGAA